jgi:hypothetical protein
VSFALLRQYILQKSFAELGHLSNVIRYHTDRILRRAERRRYGNMAKELSAELFMQKEDDGLGGVDGRTTADGDDDISTGLFECIYANANSGNGGVRFNVVEGGRMAILFT